MTPNNSPILFVDLDESLIKTDISREQFIRSFSKSPWNTLKMVFRERFRPERVKSCMIQYIDIDPATLPYNQDVMAVIHQAKSEGRQVVLATASHVFVAQKIADHLGVFDAVLATTAAHNLKGVNKLAAMEDYANGRSFDYVGDSHADLKIFPYTQMAYIVGGLPYRGPQQRFPRSSLIMPLLKAMHPAHWIKNSLIFLPILFSQSLSLAHIFTALMGFFCFCLAGSSISLIKGMVAVETDRHHAYKRNRPFARGDITIDDGLQYSFLFMALSLALTALLLPAGGWVLAAFIALTATYSLSSHNKLITNVFCLSLLYMLRVLYGQRINSIDTSLWFYAFCFFVFISLAFIEIRRKRRLPHKSET